MLLWWRKKKKKVNVVELERLFTRKVESKYARHDPDVTISNKFSIHTVSRNVPLELGVNGQLSAKIRYIGIPNLVVYFVVKISELQGEFVSSSNTVDIVVDAEIRDGELHKSSFSLYPILASERSNAVCIHS